MRRFWIGFAAFLALGILAAACADLPMTNKLPTNETNVFIQSFENRTSEPGLDALLTQRVTQNFLIDGRLKLASRENAEMLLQGTVERYDRLVMTYDQNMVPQQYKIQMVVDLTCTDQKTGHQLWTTHTIVSLTPGESMTGDEFDSTNTTSLREFTTYYVLNVAGVPPEDESTARDRLLDQMAAHVVRRTIDGF
jgi:hypothetical protein